MKTKKLYLSLATIASVISGGALAIGYDAANEQLSGIGIAEVHTWQARINFDQGECASTLCQSIQSGQSEVVSVIQFINESTCILRTVDESPLELTGSCAAPSPNEDNYCGSNLGASLPPSGCPDGTDAIVPGLPIYNTTFGDTVPPSFVPLGPITFFAYWDIDTAVNGKISGGYYLADTTFGGNTILALVDFDKRVFVYAAGDSRDAPIECWANPATVTESDYISCADNSTPTFGDPVRVSHVSGIDYITVDDTQLGAKAVPVPAFAAAALGLGLVGVTVLTGRRRQVK